MHSHVQFTPFFVSRKLRIRWFGGHQLHLFCQHDDSYKLPLSFIKTCWTPKCENSLNTTTIQISHKSRWILINTVFHLFPIWAYIYKCVTGYWIFRSAHSCQKYYSAQYQSVRKSENETQDLAKATKERKWERDSRNEDVRMKSTKNSSYENYN